MHRQFAANEAPGGARIAGTQNKILEFCMKAWFCHGIERMWDSHHSTLIYLGKMRRLWWFVRTTLGAQSTTGGAY